MSHKATGYRNVYRRGETYYYRFRDERGKWIERRYGTNLKDAALAQRRTQDEADAIRAGLTTRAKISEAHHRTRDYETALAEYIAHLKAQKNHPDHINTVNTKCSIVAKALGWKTLDDINVGQFDAFLTVVLQEGKSARTRNDYLRKLNGFANWCGPKRRKYLPENPLQSLDNINEANDQRRPVRALTPNEFAALLAAAKRNRPLAYWLAGGLGLRWTEIRKIRWAQVDLQRGWITLPASISKNRKETAVPMPPAVADALRAIPQKERRECICPHPPNQRTFKRDVESAKIKPNPDAGGVHRRSLRKTFITHLAISGVDLRIAQRLARHSRPELTANIYTDPHLLDMKDAMKRMSNLHAKSGNRVAKKKNTKKSPKKKR